MIGALELFPSAKLGLLRQLLTGEASSAELAAVSRSDVTVVRRHLARLNAAGIVTSRWVPQARGRPRAMFALTQEGRELFGSRYDRLLELLLQAEVERDGEKATARACARAAHLLACELGRPRGTVASLPLLREIGFNPMVETQEGRVLVVSRNCPVLKVAKEHPTLVCDAFHSTLLHELTGTTRVRTRESLARGATRCAHELLESRRSARRTAAHPRPSGGHGSPGRSKTSDGSTSEARPSER